MQEYIVRNNHMTKPLPCINTQQRAAKTISKVQQTLVFFTALFPQFIQAEQPLLPQFFILTATSLTNAFIFIFAYALAGYNFKNKLLPMLNSGLISKITASLFLCFATVLAVTK